MNIFDILGPIMVGPSSSHTAGAVRIGLITRKLLGEKPVKATIGLHGSFSATGVGHGTDRAIVAGVLGMKPDDMRVPESFIHAKECGLDFTISSVEIKDAHPNTALLDVEGESGRKLTVQASSVGGGRIMVDKVDGIAVNCSCEMHTLIVHNDDKPGHISSVSGLLAKNGINIATMSVYRHKRGGRAIMVVEVDEVIPTSLIYALREEKGIVSVTYIAKESE